VNISSKSARAREIDMVPNADTGDAMTITTRRLLLVPASIESLEAMIDGSASAFQSATGFAAPDPLAAPPLMEDALAYFVDRLRAEPDLAPWWARWIIDRERELLVGSAGGSGRPDPDGIVTIGYAIYPHEQRRGFAREAVSALVTWLLAEPSVIAVQATIPLSHTPSERVAEASGLRFTGRSEVTDVGEIGYWERRQP
jgi:[ribosomal protein S5]-alanine N-acetyltransferase